jgi:hypothetical protein
LDTWFTPGATLADADSREYQFLRAEEIEDQPLGESNASESAEG